MLANAEATIVDVAGQDKYREHANLRDVAPGISWAEAERGTNALGTAVTESRPLIINSGEHFLDRLRDVSCVSVLITDAEDGLAGVLCMARYSPLPEVNDGLTMLTMAAANISNRLFAKAYPEHYILALHSDSRYVDTPVQGLLVLDQDGLVQGANKPALQLLKRKRDALLGMAAQELFKETLQADTLIRKSAGSLTCQQGKLYYRLLQWPDLSSSARGRSTHLPPRRRTGLSAQGSYFEKGITALRRGMEHGLPVLLTGELGTGKGLLAKQLHKQITMGSESFVEFCCSTMARSDLEAALFGSLEQEHLGALQQANGGTLLLSSVETLPGELQQRLLRILRSKKMPGSPQGSELKLNLIAASDKDLSSEVRAGAFSEELYYYLSNLSLQLPPLRDRNDLEAICEQILEEEGVSSLTLSEELLTLLKGYHWPGNIHQMKMMLRTLLAIRAPDVTELCVEDLPKPLVAELQQRKNETAGLDVRRNENLLISRAIERHNGNISAAARELGVSRATLYRKIKQLEI